MNINPQMLIATRKPLIFAVVMVVVAAGILVMGVFPQAQDIFELQADFSQEKPKLSQVQKKLIELENVQLSPDFTQLELVDAALPSHKPLLELLASLNTISNSEQVIVEDLQLSPGEIATESGGFLSDKKIATSKKKASTIDLIEFSLKASGDPVRVRNFLQLIEKFTPFTTITQLSVETKKNPDRQEVMSAEIVAQTYFFTQTLSATIEAPLPQLAENDREVLQEIANYVNNDLPKQTEVTGGGLNDLFGVKGFTTQ